MIKFRKYLLSVNLSLKPWFSEAVVYRCFSKELFLKISQYSLEKNLCWPLHTFFYRTPTLAACRFSRRTCFCPELLWKHELNVRSSHQSSSVKRGVFRIFASFTGRQLCWSLFLIELQTFRPAALLKIDYNTDVFPWNLQDFYLIWSLRTPASEACSFTWTSLFNNLDFWLKLVYML